MPVSILMPALSPTMTEGTLSKWVKKEGDDVAAGDVIAEIETDKATMEVEAVDEGTLGKILIEEGASGVAVNTPIAVLLEEDDDKDALEEFLKNDAQRSGQDNKSTKSDKQDEKSNDTPEASQSKEPALASQTNNSKDGGRVKASPLARRLADQYGVQLSSVKGSGPNGRIVKADVEQAKKSGGASAAASRSGGGALPQAQGPDARALADMLGMEYEALPNSNMRKTIASRLLESKVTVPHFYLTVECRIDSLMQMRAQINEAADGAYKLSVNDFIIKASAMALQKVPAANASWTESHIIQYKNSDISVAVATESGLITPIIKDAEDQSLRDISTSMKDLAKRAREGKLKPVEYQGGTFSISNLGMYGIKNFSAIINPPQACILAVGAGFETPVVEKGVVKAANVMSCTLSCDHRVVDGAVGAEFLQAFQDFIENPAKLFA
jgi:pyruvate dehydrogenase E2 component (dihydrolipoamide acetyltransferase)